MRLRPGFVLLAAVSLLHVRLLGAGSGPVEIPLTVVGAHDVETVEVAVVLEARPAPTGDVVRFTGTTRAGSLSLRLPAVTSGWRLQLTPTNTAFACALFAWAGDLPWTEAAFAGSHLAEHRPNPVLPEALVVRLPAEQRRPQLTATRRGPGAGRRVAARCWTERQVGICWHIVADDTSVTTPDHAWLHAAAIERPVATPRLPESTLSPDLCWPSSGWPDIYSRMWGADYEVSGLPWPAYGYGHNYGCWVGPLDGSGRPYGLTPP
jgi:hypothetical protein